ncbi:MAG: hypothetical protein KDB27_34395 [Planctomycetales bacterium]|nr:hypothetical protein [Planctomycetales bacterium]
MKREPADSDASQDKSAVTFQNINTGKRCVANKFGDDEIEVVRLRVQTWAPLYLA